MKVAFDTNVIIDAIADQDETNVAQTLFMAAADGTITGVISANTVTDVHYIARRYIGAAAIRNAIAELLTIFEVAPIDGEVCLNALGNPNPDFEDAVLAESVAQYGAQYVATNDQKFIKAPGSPIPVKKASDVLALIQSELLS